MPSYTEGGAAAVAADVGDRDGEAPVGAVAEVEEIAPGLVGRADSRRRPRRAAWARAPGGASGPRGPCPFRSRGRWCLGPREKGMDGGSRPVYRESEKTCPLGPRSLRGCTRRGFRPRVGWAPPTESPGKRVDDTHPTLVIHPFSYTLSVNRGTS